MFWLSHHNTTVLKARVARPHQRKAAAKLGNSVDQHQPDVAAVSPTAQHASVIVVVVDDDVVAAVVPIVAVGGGGVDVVIALLLAADTRAY